MLFFFVPTLVLVLKKKIITFPSQKLSHPPVMNERDPFRLDSTRGQAKPSQANSTQLKSTQLNPIQSDSTKINTFCSCARFGLVWFVFYNIKQ